MKRNAFVDGAVAHVEETTRSLGQLVNHLDRLERWGQCLAQVLCRGGRLLAAGNGGSAAHAQHLTSELVGRYQHERPPLSAIALHGDASALTAVMNDYGAEQAFARQLCAHARAGDVFIGFSTSGRSANVLAAASAARSLGVHAWAVTGRGPNPLAGSVDDAITVDAVSTATVQEIHQVVVHLLCQGIEAAIANIAPELAPVKVRRGA